MTVTALVALFGAGVASFLAPCVLPLVPAYLAMMSASAIDERPGGAVRAALVFVGGFSAVFATFGVLAGWFGSGLAATETAVQRVGGVLVALFGLVLLGAVRGRAMGEWRAVRALPAVGSRWRPAVMGVAFGAAWTPCVGPLLGAALVVAARSNGAARGGLLLGAYALGVGVPFVAASLVVASLPAALARLRRWSHAVERVAGVALVVLGLLLAVGRYGWLTSRLAGFTGSVG